MGRLLHGVCLQLGEVLDGADHLRGVRVLVVIPGNNLYLIGIIVDKALLRKAFGLFRRPSRRQKSRWKLMIVIIPFPKQIFSFLDCITAYFIVKYYKQFVSYIPPHLRAC